MAAIVSHRKVAVLGAVAFLSASGAAAWFTGLAPVARHGASDLLAALHSRSPGARPNGAASNKKRHAQLAQALPAKAPRVSKVLPAALAAPEAAAPLIAGAAAPVPAAIAPLAAPAAFIPAAAAGGGGAFLFPPIIIPGGGGGGGGTPPPPGGGGGPPPPGGGGGPPPVPGVPEPATWLMMGLGFAFLGEALRRRRRIESTDYRLEDAVKLA